MFRVFLVLLAASTQLLAWAEAGTFPETLDGVWEQGSGNEHGTINIVITQKEHNSIRGIMTLTGSTYCKNPIPFKGEGESDTAYISGDAKIICGYGGKLKGQVTRVNDNLYTGNFAYKWFGITWASGTFRLTPRIVKVQP